MADKILQMIFRTKKEGDAISQVNKDLTGLKTGVNDVVKGLTGFSLGSISVAAAIVGVGKAVADATKETVAYAEQVRDLSRLSGASAEETSRLIQTADDLKVSYSTLQQAAKTLAQDGIALTTEELAKSSDEYLRISDAGERAEYAVKKFGRAGLEMTKVLEAGGAAIREMAAGQNSNLILTEAQVKKAREFEIAQDALNDTFNGFKYAIGNAVLPAITSFLKGLDDLINAEARFKEKQQEKQDVLVKSAETYEEYAAAIDAANGPMLTQDEILANAAYGVGAATQQFEKLSETEWNLAKTVIPEVTWQTDQLSAATGNMGDAQKSAKEDFDLVIGSMKAVTLEMLYQKAAAGMDADAALALGRSLGVINETSYYLQSTLANLKGQLDSGKISASQYKDEVGRFLDAWNRISNKSVTLTVETKYTGNSGNYTPWGTRNDDDWYASGGSFVIPPGYPNDSYPLGPGKHATSGEIVTVQPTAASQTYGDINFVGPVTMGSQSDARMLAQTIVDMQRRGRR